MKILSKKKSHLWRFCNSCFWNLKLVRGWWVVEGNFKGTGRGKPSNFFFCRFLCIYSLPYLHPPSLQGSVSLQTLETNKIIRYVSPAFSHTQLINFLRLVTQSLCGGTRDNPMRTGYQTCIFPYFFFFFLSFRYSAGTSPWGHPGKDSVSKPCRVKKTNQWILKAYVGGKPQVKKVTVP